MERLSVRPDSDYNSFELAVHLSRYLPLRELVSRKRVLDVACGEGFAAYGMRTHWSARQVVGIDKDRKSILNARSMFGGDGLVFNCNDAVAAMQRFRGGFDVAVSVETIEHVDDPVALLEGLSRSIGDNGLIYVTCPNDQWYYGPGKSLNPHHKNVYDFEEFRTLSEDTLGPADHWFLGSRIDGFATAELNSINTAADWTSALSSGFLDSGNLACVPLTSGREMTVSDSLFFAGLWSRGSKASCVPRTSVATMLTGPRKSRAPMRGFSDSLSNHKPLRSAVLVPERTEARSIHEQVAGDLAGRVDMRCIEYDGDNVTQTITSALSPQTEHLHLIGASAVSAYFFEDSVLRVLQASLGSGNGNHCRLVAQLAGPWVTCCLTELEIEDLGIDWDVVRSLSDRIWYSKEWPGDCLSRRPNPAAKWLAQMAEARQRAKLLRPARRAYFHSRLKAVRTRIST